MTCILKQNHKSGFVMYYIENRLTTKGTYASFYHKEVDKEKAREPVLVKWTTAVRFCNDLSRKYGVEPCYYLNGEPISDRNYNETGKNIECKFKNNGWRLPMKDELSIVIFSNFVDVIQREGWEWANDKNKWYNRLGQGKLMRLKVRASKDANLEKQVYTLDEIYTHSQFEIGFRLCRGMKLDEPDEIPKTVNSI